MDRNILLIALFIIIFCWKFNVFTKNDTRNYFSKGSLEPLLQESNYVNATLHNKLGKNDNSSFNRVFISEISATSDESIEISSRKFPCKSDITNDSNLEMVTFSSDKLRDESGNTTSLSPISLKEISRTLEAATEDFINFNKDYLNRNNSINLDSNYTESGNLSDQVEVLNWMSISLKEEMLISIASNDSRKTADDILESVSTTLTNDEFVITNSSKMVNYFQDQFSNDNISKEIDLEEHVSTNNRFQSNYSRKTGDRVQTLNYLYEMYDIVQGTFEKLEKVYKLVNELKLEIDHIQTKYQRLSSNDETTSNLFNKTKCTFHGSLQQLQANFDKLNTLKLSIDRGYIDVDEAMSDLAYHLTVYEELHQSNNHDDKLFEAARVEILKLIRTINSLMNKVHKDSNRFIKYVPNFKIVCN